MTAEGQPCPYGDPFCPCQDGDLCHYEGKDPLKTVSGSQRIRLSTQRSGAARHSTAAAEPPTEAPEAFKS